MGERTGDISVQVSKSYAISRSRVTIWQGSVTLGNIMIFSLPVRQPTAEDQSRLETLRTHLSNFFKCVLRGIIVEVSLQRITVARSRSMRVVSGQCRLEFVFVCRLKFRPGIYRQGLFSLSLQKGEQLYSKCLLECIYKISTPLGPLWCRHLKWSKDGK